MNNQVDGQDHYLHEMDWTRGDDAVRLTNYKSYQHDLIKSYFGKKILEIGSGNRLFTKLIVDSHPIEELLSIEPSDTLFDLYEGKYAFPDNVRFEKLDLFVLSPDDHGRFDTIVMVHVLEHVEQDREAVVHLADMLEADGHLLIEVPALPFLFSQHDTSLGHYRRYTAKSLRSVVDPEQFDIVDCWYQDPIGVLGSLLFFKLMKIRLKTEQGFNLVANQGRFYDRVLIPMQQKVEKHVRFPVGLSVTLVARRRRGTA